MHEFAEIQKDIHFKDVNGENIRFPNFSKKKFPKIFRYNLPRFEGYPPTSPDFLRLVLIEGCSLLIIDYTTSLFAAYYEKRERTLRRRKQFESFHNIVMSGLMFAAASAAFFLNSRHR